MTDPRAWPRHWRIGALAAAWLATGIYIVPADEQAVVTRWGAVSEARVLPGIHAALPWPVDRVARLRVRQLQRLIVGGEAAQFLTGDQNIIDLSAAVQYSVAAPAEYLFTAAEVRRLLGAAVESELARRVAQLEVDEVFTTGKAAIQEHVRGAAQRLADRYRLGVAVASVNIEFAAPPAEAREAFNDVASARADSARIVSEAQGYAGDLVPKARGEASRMLEGAAGERAKKIDEARGDAARFVQTSVEYERAAAVNGRRLYLEAMEQILPRIKKVLVDSRGNLDLTVIRERTSR